ncbi:hypothetical protein ACMD2_22985 [Ananas comosus]|uniref:DUF2996 domain-containing protein n=1 Tax=Ananas comosus TaxID=4615 RepID=A0A199UMV3_ANACO|nr:hypothetical protein ACMD2_22985 [Ananas comosus]
MPIFASLRRHLFGSARVFYCNCNMVMKYFAAVTDKEGGEAEAEAESKAATPAAKAVPGKAKKAPAKALPELMEEEVIPALRSTLEAQEDVSQVELSFQDNRLEGSFLKNNIPYCFWAFFPNGVLTGPKGFSLSSYGSVPSTVEPFLIDEKRITARHVVFWVEKRLAAQGILPVWKGEESEEK